MKKKIIAKINQETTVQRDPEQDFSKIDNEVVMLNLQNGEYYALNEVASRIWEMIERPVSVKDLIVNLTKEYKVHKEECEKDTIRCLTNLNNKNLILININV